MSEITSEELGRRRFQVLRDKAAEQALEKIRKSVGEQGQSLSSDENSIIREILKEIWSGVDYPVWESFCFTKLSHEDLYSILAIAKNEKNRKEMIPKMAETLKKILLEKL